MRIRFPIGTTSWSILAGTLAFGLTASTTHGQSPQLPEYGEPFGQPAPIGQAPGLQVPQIQTPALPNPAGGPTAGTESGAVPGATGGPASALTPPGFNELGTAPSPASSALNQFGGGEQFAALGSRNLPIADNVGYIDSAIIRSNFRLRYDSAYDNNRPDRAEFFYPKCGCFAQLPVGNPFRDPRAPGPPNPKGETRVDYQELAPYLEYAPSANFSAFAEMPARFINPSLNKNAYGFSDMNLGFKYALSYDVNHYYTFQFRTYVPTGVPSLGLGTGHPSLEPGLLVFQRLSDRLFFSGEVRDWIPLRGTDFAGNVLRYGAGLTYNAYQSDSVRIAPVTEFVGWSVLGGKKLNPGPAEAGGGVASAAGDTIVNGKFGLRIGFGDYSRAGGGSGLNDRSSLYIGYGQALTGDHWYKEIIRVEYRFYF